MAWAAWAALRTNTILGFDDGPASLVWLTDGSGRGTAVQTREPWDTDSGGESSRSLALEEALNELGQAEGLPGGGLAKVGGRIVLFARRAVVPAGGQASGHLWLGRTLDSASLGRIGAVIGGSLVLVGTGTVPHSELEGTSTTHTLWLSGQENLAVAWLALDAAGGTLGCFRADLSVGHIVRQSATARRMVLIILSLSAALVLLVILGAHMLIAGPVIRLMTRLRSFETGKGGLRDLGHNLHGEPLVLARRLESAFDKLAEMSQTDRLTGLANRHHFEEVLDCFYHQARRYNRPLSLICMDIDFFKAVNDTGGHQSGDRLLILVAQTIEQACRKADLPARFGGDEFAVLLPETTIADATAMAERIREAIGSREHLVNSVRMNVTTSIGLTDLNTGGIDSGEAMLAMADSALYAAKGAGRNCTVKAHELEGVTWKGQSEQGVKVNTLCKKLAGLDNQFKGLFLQAVEEIMEILEQRDPYMADHARKVQHLAVMIAEEMGLPERVVKRVEIAAMLHDIGMLAMPDKVLLCESELEGEQLDIMRKHPLYSVRIMEGMEFLEQEIPAVRYHHERFDGTGYPEGLSGGAIPLTARILAVADVFDAMTSCRTFREARSLESALEETRKVAGTQLDPVIVDAFMALADRLGQDLLSPPAKRARDEEPSAPPPVNAAT